MKNSLPVPPPFVVDVVCSANWEQPRDHCAFCEGLCGFTQPPGIHRCRKSHKHILYILASYTDSTVSPTGDILTVEAAILESNMGYNQHDTTSNTSLAAEKNMCASLAAQEQPHVSWLCKVWWVTRKQAIIYTNKKQHWMQLRMSLRLRSGHSCVYILWKNSPNKDMYKTNLYIISSASNHCTLQHVVSHIVSPLKKVKETQKPTNSLK